MRALSLAGFVAVAVLALGAAFAHEDVVDRFQGAVINEDPLVGQGRETGQDRAYAFWAQYDDNLTDVLELPKAKKWITVAEAIPWAKKVWDVNILDETGDPEVGKIKLAMALGPVEREMALPLFLEALNAAVHGIQECYVEQDETRAYSGAFRNYHKGTVHIRKARPLQPDYDHPFDPDKQAIWKLETEVRAEPRLTDRFCAPTRHLHERCMDCQAEAAQIVALYAAKGGAAAANSPECLKEMAQACAKCPHCQTYWISRHDEPRQPEAKPGEKIPITKDNPPWSWPE